MWQKYNRAMAEMRMAPLAAPVTTGRVYELLVDPDDVDAAACDEHDSVLQVWLENPLQNCPPLEGAGLTHERVCVPPSHVVEQADQPDHCPSTAVVQPVDAVQVCEVSPTHVLPPPLGEGLVHVRV